MWDRFKSKAEKAGIPLFLLGIGLLALATLMALRGWNLSLAVLSVGLGTISAGIGFVAVGIATKSDRVIAAMADLHFDEKLVVMRRYHAQEGTPRKDVVYDVRAALRVKQWAGASAKSEFR